MEPRYDKVRYIRTHATITVGSITDQLDDLGAELDRGNFLAALAIVREVVQDAQALRNDLGVLAVLTPVDPGR